MPYKYAFVRAIAPNYLRVPNKDEQFKYEMRLERHLRNWKKLREKWDALDVGANDVPLDERGLAVGKIPEHALPMDQSERFGGSGRRPRAVVARGRPAHSEPLDLQGAALRGHRRSRSSATPGSR